MASFFFFATQSFLKVFTEFLCYEWMSADFCSQTFDCISQTHNLHLATMLRDGLSNLALEWLIGIQFFFNKKTCFPQDTLTQITTHGSATGCVNRRLSFLGKTEILNTKKNCGFTHYSGGLWINLDRPGSLMYTRISVHGQAFAPMRKMAATVRNRN